MEQMINQDLIKKIRNEKCWSQEHLALVSGVSLRTVQRIENEGKCSIDSKKALAAALELDVKELNSASPKAVLPVNDKKLKAAISWLENIDAGKYSLSWKESAPLFQSRVSRHEWIKTLSQVRAPLGYVVSREVGSAIEHHSLPGVPDGEYIVITFKSSFAEKQSALETVTLSKANNDWQVVGYFIK